MTVTAPMLTPWRLEMCRIVRENCYHAVIPMRAVPQDEIVVRLAQAALDTPIETMAGWFVKSDTVMANIQLAMTMVQDDLVY